MLKGRKKGPKRRFALNAAQQVQGGFLYNYATIKQNQLWNVTYTHKDRRANESVKYIYIIYFANQRTSKKQTSNIRSAIDG